MPLVFLEDIIINYLLQWNDFNISDIFQIFSYCFKALNRADNHSIYYTLKREYQKVAMGEIDENEKRQVYSLLNKENVVFIPIFIC